MNERFVKTYCGTKAYIDSEINTDAQKHGLTIISVSIAYYGVNGLYASVVFEKKLKAVKKKKGDE